MNQEISEHGDPFGAIIFKPSSYDPMDPWNWYIYLHGWLICMFIFKNRLHTVDGGNPEPTWDVENHWNYCFFQPYEVVPVTVATIVTGYAISSEQALWCIWLMAEIFSRKPVEVGIVYPIT